MKEVRSTIESFILNHDRNKRFLALFLALAILVSFAVPASLIQPANSMTANSDGGAALLSDTTGIPTSDTIGAPATGEGLDTGGNLHKGFFKEVCTFIPKGADDLEESISKITVTVTDSSGQETVYEPTDGKVTIPAGSAEDVEFKLGLSYSLDSSDIDKLSIDEPCMYYVLPENFKAFKDMYGADLFIQDTETGPGSFADLYPQENNVAAHVSVQSGTGLIVIQFTEAYLEYMKAKKSAEGTFTLSGTIGRSNTADGDSSVEIGDFTVEAEFEDRPNEVTKSQGTVAPNANGGADITWTVTVYDKGYGLDGWTVSDNNFPGGGSGVTISPDGVSGTWNGTKFTFGEIAEGISSVTFTYTQTLSIDEIDALYDADKLTVTNNVTITNPDGLTDNTENNAYIERPSIDKEGKADYEDGEYGQFINWEITVEHPYGGSLNGYSVVDQQYKPTDAYHCKDLAVKDIDGNDVSYSVDDSGAITINQDVSQVVITYASRVDSPGSSITNSATLKDNDGDIIGEDSSTVNYEKATNLSKQGVYDPESQKIVWIVTAESHIGVLDNYRIYDYSVFGTNGTITSMDQIDVISVNGQNGGTVYSDLTAVKNDDGSITYKDSNGNEYGTVSFVEDGTNSTSLVNVTSTDSVNGIGITMVQFSFSTPVTEGQTQYSNSVQDDSGNGDTVTVTPSCQYAIDKSGSYNAANGTIEWTISVKNNTALDTASLNGVTLTDAALKGMSASDLALSWAKDTSGNYNFTLSSSGNVVTISDSTGNSVATLTIDSDAGTIAFSNVAESFNDIGLKYTKAVSAEDIQAAASNTVNINNTLSAEVPDGNNPPSVEESVVVTNPYKLEKSGAYDAATGNIIWTVIVQNQSGTLDGVTLTDDAFANLASGTEIEILYANGYAGYTVNNIISTGLNNSFTFGNNGEYGTMVLSGDTITFANASDGKGVQYVKFTYQTKAQNTADGATETNTISSNKLPDVVSDTVTITNPYSMSKNGVSYDPETGLLTWQVTVQNGSGQYSSDAGTLGGVVLVDEALKGLSIDSINVTNGAYSYHALSQLSKDGNVITVANEWGVTFGTVTFDSANGTLSFEDDGTHSDGYYYGLFRVTFTYTTKATPEQIAAGKATNTIGTHSSGVGPSNPSSAEIPITKRDDIFTKTYNGQDMTVYGDGESTYALDWTINVRKDDGYSSNDLVLVDSLSATNGGTHYITADQLGKIVIKGKSLSTESYQTLSPDLYTIVGVASDSDGKYEGFEVTFDSGIDTANYRYIQITYQTTADVSGVVGQGSGTDAVFTNSASFGSNSASDGFTYTEIPADYVETIDITVKKTWSDESNKHNSRIESIQFALKQKIDNGEWTYYDKDGDGTIEVSGEITDDLFTISTNGADTWSLLVEDLPKTTSNADGLKPIYYQVEEVSKVSGYTTTYNGNGDYVNTSGSIIEIINTLDCIKVYKTWVDNENGYSTRPTSISVQLQRRAKGSNDAWTDVTENGAATLPDNGNWSYTFTGIDPDIYEYRVVEGNVDGYKTEYTNNDGISTGEITIKNTLVTVNVTKQWQDYESGTTPPDVTVTLQYSSDNGETWQDYTDASGNAYTATLKNGSFSALWYGLNAEYIYRVVESGAPEGYITKYNGSADIVSIDGVTSQYITITNTSNNIKVSKIWSDSGNEDKRQPVVIHLYKVNGDGTKTEVEGSPKTITDTSNSYESVTWYGLDPNGVYEVVEESIDGYVTSYSTNNISGGSVNVTNTYNNIKINKVWKDINGNTVTPDVGSIKLNIYQKANGAPAISGNITECDISTNDENSNIVAIYQLPDLVAGDKVTIKLNGSASWVETYIQYNGVLGGNDSEGNWVSMPWNGTIDYFNGNCIEYIFDITEDISNAVIQTYWNDKDATQNYISSVDYSIDHWDYYSTVIVTPDESGNWTYNLSGLPTGSSPGEYIYKVVEESIDGYYATYYNNDGVNPTSNQTIEITNSEAEKINKVAYDKDGNAITSGSLIKPNKLQTATIDGTECYLIEYVISSNRSGNSEQTSMVVDTLPEGWTLCEDPNDYTNLYGPFRTVNNTEGSIAGWTNTTYYKNNGSTVSFYFGWAQNIRYFIKIPVDTLDKRIEENNSVLVENTVVSESENSSPTTNKILVSESTSGNTDENLLDKIASVMNGTLKYTVVFNPDGKNLANGDTVDLIDDFNIVDYILESSGGSISADQLAQIEVALNSIKVEHVQNITYTEYGTIEYEQIADLNPSYRFDKDGRSETEVTELEIVYAKGDWSETWTATGFEPGDVITFTIKATGLPETLNSNGKIGIRYNYQYSSNYVELDSSLYDDSSKTWTVQVTVPENCLSIAVDGYEFESGEWNYARNNITDVSAIKSKTTKLSDTTINMSVPDETPLVITYTYTLGGITMKAGDKLTANNEISFDTGNASASDSADKTEFVITDAFGTIAAGTDPVIKKVSISDYSVEVAAEFKMAYYDETLGWVFAVEETPVTDKDGNPTGTVRPIWTTGNSDTVSESNTVHTNANTIPSGKYTHTFKLGSININLESGKLYKMIEVSMPFGYEGYDLAADYNSKIDSYSTSHPEYAAKVLENMDAAVDSEGNPAPRKSAVFEDLLQAYLAGVTGPYDDFFKEFEAVYYFAYQDADYSKPDGFNGTVTTVSTTGELMLNNSEMIEIKIDKSWDEMALEAIGGKEVKVQSIVELYWSTVKKSTGFPDDMEPVDAETFKILNETDFANPKTVEKGVSAVWGLLPSGYQGQPIYYYVKEVGYIIGDDVYWLNEQSGEYILVNSITDKNPQLDSSGNEVTGPLKPIYTGNGTNNTSEYDPTSGKNKQVSIKIQNTAGLKIEKLWRTSDNKDFADVNMKPPLSEVPIILFGIRADTGQEEMIGEIDTFKVTAEDGWNLVIDEKDFDLSAYKSFRVVENIPADQQHLIYGYSVSYTYNTNGPSGTITITNKDNTPTEIDVTVNKVWADSADHSADSVTVQLYQTTTEQPLEGIVADGTAYGDPVVLSLSNSWSNTWSPLPYKDSVSGLRYYYYVVETAVDVATGKTYKASYSRNDPSLSLQSLTVTNYVPGSIIIEKNWIDKNRAPIDATSPLLPEGIEVDIYCRPDVDMVTSTGGTIEDDLNVVLLGDSITQGTSGSGGPYLNYLDDLMPSSTTYKNGGQDGNAIMTMPDGTYYTSGEQRQGLMERLSGITELPNADVVLLMIGTNDMISNYTNYTKERLTDLIDAIYAITGTEDTVILIASIPDFDFVKSDGTYNTVESWFGTSKGFDRTGIYADVQTFEDYVNDTMVVNYNKVVKDLVDKPKSTWGDIEFVDVNAAVDKDTELADGDGCHPNALGYESIANAFYDGIKTYYGVGTVETPKDIDGVPEDITDTSKYEHVGTYTLEAEKDWKRSIELPTMNDSNVNYVYYVVEKTTGYTVAYDSNGQIISDNDGDTITVTNTVDTAKTSITVEKVWYDNESVDRPASIELQLQQRLETASDWTNIGETFTLTSENEWKTTIADLDVTNLDAVKYYYQVVETVPSGYTVTYGDTNGDAAQVAGTTITVTNTKTFDLTVKKVWADENHILNEGVTINIYRDTVEKEDGLTIMPIELALESPADGHLTITQGKTATVTVNKAGTTVSFSNNLASAEVNDKTITVTAGDTTGDTVMTITDEAGQTVQVNITVTDKPTLILALTPSVILAGETSEISAELSDGTSISDIEYTITEGTAATLDGNILTGVNAGEVTVKATAKTADGDTYEETITLTVKLSDSFTLSASSSTVNVDSTVAVTPSPSHGTFEFESSDSTVATVDKDTGVVTGKSAGTVTITAKRSDGETATVEITVQEIPLTVTPESVELTIGGEKQLTVSDSNVTYTPADSSIVSVSETGLIKALAAGETTITVTTKDGKQFKTVTVKVVDADIYTNDNVTIYVGVGETKTIYTASRLGDMWDTNDSIATITYVSGDEQSSITITGVSVGTFSPSVNLYGPGYKGTKFTIVVTEAGSGGDTGGGEDTTPLEITPSSVELTVGGDSVTLSANKDDVTYSIKSGNDYITLSGNSVSPVAAGEAVITATCGDETVDIPVTVSESTGGGEEIGGDTVTGTNLDLSNSPSVSIDSTKTVSTISITLSDDTVNGSHSNFTVYIGNYLAGAVIDSQNGNITVSQEWGGCTYTLSGNTVTLTLNKSADSITFGNYSGSNVLSSYTITYASTAPASYSLRGRVSYAPPTRAYAVLADVTYPELVKTITITSSDIDWTQIVTGLPVYDSNGKQYYYWIEEVGANGFTPSYSFSDGDDNAIDADYCINAANPGDAIATVKNTPNDTQTSLPSTGGQGTQRYYVTGIALMLCALAGICGFKRRQRSQS